MLEPIALLKANWIAITALVAFAALLVSSAARRGALALMRVLAHPLLLLAAVALVYDGTRTLAGAGLVVTSLAEHWQNLAPASLEASRTFVSHRLTPALWDPVITSALRLPSWLALGGLGLALAYIGRKRRAVNVFAN